MKRVKEKHYSEYLELAGLNTCNTVYPMAEYVLSIGKEPVWDCDAANVGSRATAERAGFDVVLRYAYFKVK